MRPILADAVDLARRALLELEPSAVGAHLGVIAEDESAATHRFEATLPGYRGWQWAVVVAAPPGADRATVSESALLPGPDALVAPEFVPWEQRVRPGDLAPGDLLAPPADDPRLVPGYVATGDPVVDEVAYEVGLGRTKVMSREGRAEAAERWYSEYGPDSEMAKAAPATCGSCGFYLPLAGSLRAAFGVCGNAMGADGHVVHVAYGCGAHSDTEVPTGNGSPLYEAYDDSAIEVITLRTDEPRDGQAEASPSEDVDRHGAAEQAEGAGSAENVVAESPAVAENTVSGENAVAANAAPGENAVTGSAASAENALAETGAVAIPAAEVGEIDGPALGTGDANVPAAADSDAVPAGAADAQSAAAAPSTAVEPDSRAVATEPGSHGSSSATSPAEPSAASSVTDTGVDHAQGTAAPVSDESAGSAPSGPTEADAAGSTSTTALSSGTSTDVGESNAAGTSATESDTASTATESVAAAGSDAVPTGAAESAPASDAVAQTDESASSPIPGPEPTATPAGAEDVDAPSGAGVAEGEARPEFQSSPRS